MSLLQTLTLSHQWKGKPLQAKLGRSDSNTGSSYHCKFHGSFVSYMYYTHIMYLTSRWDHNNSRLQTIRKKRVFPPGNVTWITEVSNGETSSIYCSQTMGQSVLSTFKKIPSKLSHQLKGKPLQANPADLTPTLLWIIHSHHTFFLRFQLQPILLLQQW